MRKLAACLWLACVVCCASINGKAAGAERAVFALLDNGARLLGLADLPDALALNGADVASSINTSDLLRVVIGERIDPNLQNDALVAVDDLQSADFATREKAVAKI